MTTVLGAAGRELDMQDNRLTLLGAAGPQLPLLLPGSPIWQSSSFQDRDPCDVHPGPAALPSWVGDTARGWGGDANRLSHTHEGQRAAAAVHLDRLEEGTGWCRRLDTA